MKQSLGSEVDYSTGWQENTPHVKTHGDFDPAKIPVTLLPDSFTYVVFLLFSTIAWLWPIMGIFLGKWDWGGLCFGFVVSLTVFLLIHSCRIVIGKDGVTYQRLFWLLSSSFAYGSIKDVNIKIQRRRSPVYGLLLSSHGATPEKPLLINIKPFSRKSLKRLLIVIRSKAPQARFDEQCQRMMEGYMPSVFDDQMDEKTMRSRSRLADFLLKDR